MVFAKGFNDTISSKPIGIDLVSNYERKEDQKIKRKRRLHMYLYFVRSRHIVNTVRHPIVLETLLLLIIERQNLLFSKIKAKISGSASSPSVALWIIVEPKPVIL